VQLLLTTVLLLRLVSTASPQNEVPEPYVLDTLGEAFLT
jgi:hypothetical protein